MVTFETASTAALLDSLVTAVDFILVVIFLSLICMLFDLVGCF